jgi:hypothetical protein
MWMARAPRAASAALASLRAFELQAAEHGDVVWIGGDELDEQLSRALRCVEQLEVFEVRDDGWLARVGERTPSARAPKLAWSSFGSLVRPRLRSAVSQDAQPGAAPLTLVRSTEFEESTGLVLALDAWAGWCEHAPLVRLERLSFAASSDCRVYVRGEPLPPLPGTYFVERDGLALPAGWKLDPALEPACLARGLGLAPGDVALFAHAAWERIEAANFVRASRSAARATRSEARRG